jgi:hypothetical protein
VRHEAECPALLREAEDPVDALPLERLVPDREDLVQQEDVRLHVHGNRKTEPHQHPGRVGAHGEVDEPIELRERDDLVEEPVDLAPLQPVDRTAQVDVLTAREVGMEACAELEQRPNRPAHLDASRRRPKDPGNQAEQRRLP